MRTGKLPSTVTVTHLPTGLKATCADHRDSHHNKMGAIEKLQALLDDVGHARLSALAAIKSGETS